MLKLQKLIIHFMEANDSTYTTKTLLNQNKALHVCFYKLTLSAKYHGWPVVIVITTHDQKLQNDNITINFYKTTNSTDIICNQG